MAMALGLIVGVIISIIFCIHDKVEELIMIEKQKKYAEDLRRQLIEKGIWKEDE